MQHGFKQQSKLFVEVSAELSAFGIATAAIPDFVPSELKVPIIVASWLADIVSFSIKEALGVQTPNNSKA